MPKTNKKKERIEISWKEAMGWVKWKRKILKRILDGRYIFIIENWLNNKWVSRIIKRICLFILFGKWMLNYKIFLDSNRDYIEIIYE